MAESAEELYRKRFGLAPEGGSFESPDLPDAVSGILSRASVRRFTDEAVPEGLVTMLLACAQSAPSKSNLQQYSILRLSDPGKREKLRALLGRTGWALDAPLFLLFLGDTGRNRKIAALRGYPYANNNADSFMNAAVDAALALQAFITVAEASGLGCCPISAVRELLAELRELLGLPEGVFPICGLSVGWPAEKPKVSYRLPPSLVLHEDRYDDAKLEAEVAAYDERVFEVAPIPVEKQRHVDRYGPAERGLWSENVARQLSLPERADFREWLAGQGIALD